MAEIDGFSLPEAVRCPCCGKSMIKDVGSIRCTGEKSHLFDIAKEGYVNLLPPGRKKNARTGDGPEMIRARREFLAGGHYDRYSAEAASLAAALLGTPDAGRIGMSAAGTVPSDDSAGANTATGEVIRTSGDLVMIDAGCGEGRHTMNMARTLRDSFGVDVTAIGFDASKYGAAASAKQYVKRRADTGITPFFAAANIFSMPVADSSADVLANLFAPLPDAEARRVLKRGGILLVCSAGERHLAELREILYDDPSPVGHGAKLPAGFMLAAEHVSEYKIHLSAHDEIESLFAMTPFYHNAPAAGKERLASADKLCVTVQVKCAAAVKL